MNPSSTLTDPSTPTVATWSGPRTASLSDLFRKAILIRAFEQRLLELFAAGQLFGTVHTCIGQEFTGLAVAEYLEPGDLVFSNHRCHGHYLAHTDDVDGLLAEIMGRQSGICGGRGGSQHICARGFYSNGIQGGIAPISAGLALAQRLKGTTHIAVVFIGDGTLGEGALYETLNIASKWQLPLLIVLENNLYAQSTAQSETLAGSIDARAAAFGIETRTTSTWAVLDLMQTAGACAATVRRERRPVFLRIDTYRLMAHSKGDDDRDPVEVKAYWARDPVAVFEEQDPAAAEMRRAATARLDEAVRRASESPYSIPGGGDDTEAANRLEWRATPLAGGQRIVESIRAALERNMERDGRIVLLGEDIRSPYGGAFKVTKGLSDKYPERVFNSPISESAIVGIGIGLAMSGLRPVCEIMFGDFLTLAADQIINHAAKFPYMYNDQVTIPLIIRTPMGGKRGYGPTHSQSLEKHFLGLPHTRVIAIHPRFDPGAVYDTLFASNDRTTIVIENKLLYSHRLPESAPDGFVVEHTDEAYPTTRISSNVKPDVTILCYGGMLPEVEHAAMKAFDEHEIACEIICPLQLYPLNPLPLIDSVHRSRRLLIVEEGLSFSAFGAEVVAQLCERNPGVLERVARLSAPLHPIPSCGPLEKQLLPGEGAILRAAIELTSHG